MGIQSLNDTELLKATKTVVQREREVLIEVLHHLREIDRRRLYSALKYRSLYDYATKELGYSEDQAYRRINAMRMIREMPVIEQKVGDGRISLSALAAANSVIKAEAKQAHKENGAAPSFERKLELVNAVEGLSRREAEGVLQSLTGLELNTTETIRAKGDALEIKMIISAELHEKLEKLKGWLAHSNPNLSTSELIEKLCDDAIAAHEKKLGQKNRATQKHSVSATIENRTETENVTSHTRSAPTRRVCLKAKIKKQIWLKADSKCENCGSHQALQIDHITPLARRGSNEPENLRLLCRACNQRAAVETVGLTKMQRFLERRLD